MRGLITYLDNISDEDIIKLELQTGNPICYELDDNLKPITHYYLKENKEVVGDENERNISRTDANEI